jgi:hypothetical protein
MRYLYTFLLLVAVSVFGYSQYGKPVIRVDKIELIGDDNKYAGRSLTSKVSSMVKGKFKVADYGLITLSGAISTSDPKTINGMDTYTIADVTTEYTLKASGKKADNLSITTKCKGSSERDLYSKIGTSLARNSDHREELMAFIQAYIEENYGSCSEISGAINNFIAKKEVKKAYGVLGYYDVSGKCEDEKEKMELAIIEAYKESACTNLTHEAEILANSGSVYKLSKAVDKLLMIPPDASCKDDVIRISELINKNAQELNANNAKKLSERISIHNNLSAAEWRSYYRKNYYR